MSVINNLGNACGFVVVGLLCLLGQILKFAFWTGPKVLGKGLWLFVRYSGLILFLLVRALVWYLPQGLWNGLCALAGSFGSGFNKGGSNAWETLTEEGRDLRKYRQEMGRSRL